MITNRQSKKIPRVVLIILVLVLLFVYNCHLYSILMQSQKPGFSAMGVKNDVVYRPLTYKMHEKLSFMYKHLYNKNVTVLAKAASMWSWTPKPIRPQDNKSPIKNATKCKLDASPLEINNGGIVTLSWDHQCANKTSMFIFLYCPSTAPTSQFIDYWSLGDVNPGEMKVSLYNIRTDCQFRLISNANTETEVARASETISFKDADSVPLHGRLAFTDNSQEMRVQWTTGAKYIPIVRYGLHRANLDMTVTGSSHTYTAKDMCGPPANLSTHFVNPGQLHDVLLSDLKPSTKYFYQYGNSKFIFSAIKSFTAPPPHGANTTVKFAMYGDMDIAPYPASEATVSHILRDISTGKVSFVVHIGDMSYATGLGYRWEEWMTMIEPVSTAVPYMVTVGNHEVGTLTATQKDPSGEPAFHPSWGNYLHDSGGECGVPLLNRFHMPDTGNGLFWYTFTHGVVFFIQLSSEHDFTPGSHQYAWLVKVLKGIDRLETPWVIATLHRPMYCSSIEYEEELSVSLHIMESLEPILVQHNVDLFVGGHYHVYERTCRLNHSKCNSTHGMVHLVVGTGGTHLDSGRRSDNDWSLKLEFLHGYGRVMANATNLLWEFIGNERGDVIDVLSLTKNV